MNPPDITSFSPSTRRILVTGGTGRIGRHLLEMLTARGYSVRALSSKPPQENPAHPQVEWRQHDWMQSLDFTAHIKGCAAVLHLGAEIWRIPNMQRSNVEATEALAQAAEKAGVTFFGYTSSMAVYGSPRMKIVTEDSPLLTPEHDVKSEYLANESLRAYGRSKVSSERKIAALAHNVEYAVFRPGVVVDTPDILALGGWSMARRMISGLRRTQYVYVKDVAYALVWFMERALQRTAPQPGVSIYTLVDNDSPDHTYAAIFSRMHAATGEAGFKKALYLPLIAYQALDILKNRTVTLRRSMGRIFLPTDKIKATGYRHMFGMLKAQETAIAEIQHGRKKT